MALITGAGISADPPSSMPLGHEFHGKLLDLCYTAAVGLAPATAEPQALSRVRPIRRNLLGRLAASAGAVPVNAMLECFHVPVPTECHLLAAVHAARGTMTLTLNFDDGIETAYALLRGDACLPANAPGDYRVALQEWRHAARPDWPLTVVSPSPATADYQTRPLLVKLRGSVGMGFDSRTLSTRTGSPDQDEGLFSKGQLGALAAAVRGAKVVIAGISGADLDCRRDLIPLLSRGAFAWTASELPAEIVAELRAIDPDQPVLRPALEGLRRSVHDNGNLLPWPRVDASGPGFDDGFGAWKTQFPLEAAAEAYASLLCDEGLARQAVPILRALLERRDSTRTSWLLGRAMRAVSGDTDPSP